MRRISESAEEEEIYRGNRARCGTVQAFPGVFFDRDGTLMEEVGYCSRREEVRVYSGVPAALLRLRRAGFKIFIITNQSGIGRGYFTKEDFDQVQTELFRQLEGKVDGVYFSTDTSDDSNTTRKPSPSMVMQAAQEHGVDLKRSYFVGDKTSDILCGKRAGTCTVLVLSGYGSSQRHCNPDFTVDNAVEAVDLIVGRSAVDSL